MILYLGVFLLTGSIVVLAGVALARSANALAEATGVGRVWIGSVLLAAATSLPEVATDVVAVRLGAPDLAAGDLFGSSMANMLILAGVDLLMRRQQVLRSATLDHALTACLAIILNALAAMFVLLRPTSTVLGVSPATILLALIYIVGTRAVYYDTLRAAPVEPEGGDGRPTAPRARPALGRFAAAALVILLAAPALAWSAKGIADLSGLGTTFIGTCLVGLATSLPELVSVLAAVRMGAFDLAVGNLFGSNAFNMVVFLAMDVASPTGAIFAALDPRHALAALTAIVLMSLGLAAIAYRAERRFALIEPGSWLMVAAYLFGLWLLVPQ